MNLDLSDITRTRRELLEQVRQAQRDLNDYEWSIFEELMKQKQADFLKVNWPKMERAARRGL